MSPRLWLHSERGERPPRRVRTLGKRRPCPARRLFPPRGSLAVALSQVEGAGRRGEGPPRSHRASWPNEAESEEKAWDGQDTCWRMTATLWRAGFHPGDAGAGPLWQLRERPAGGVSGWNIPLCKCSASSPRRPLCHRAGRPCARCVPLALGLVKSSVVLWVVRDSACAHRWPCHSKHCALPPRLPSAPARPRGALLKVQSHEKASYQKETPVS